MSFGGTASDRGVHTDVRRRPAHVGPLRECSRERRGVLALAAANDHAAVRVLLRACRRHPGTLQLAQVLGLGDAVGELDDDRVGGQGRGGAAYGWGRGDRGGSDAGRHRSERHCQREDDESREGASGG